MPRTKAGTAAMKSNEPEHPVEPEKPVDSEEHVDFDYGNDPEEAVDEEVEYEEVEEEEEEEEEVEEVQEEEEDEEEEEVEEVQEEEEDEEEEEVEEDQEEEEDEEEEEEEKDEEDDDINRADAHKGSQGDVDMPAAEEMDVEKKHAELLALPPHGSEVYLGNIPHDASEDDLKKFCEYIGEVTEVRIMKGKDDSENKGYAFVTFRSAELASKAINELNNTELKGRKVKCSTSQAKHRLFIGNVPRNWDEADMRKVVTAIGPGVNSVELLKDPQNSSRNRGFAFIEYYNHACAECSRQKMSKPDFKLDGNAPTVSWADPRNADTSASSQVKAVYVKNLPKDISQERLKDLFEHHGKITKVVLPPAKAGHENSRFGFVHFAERSSAMKALKNTEKYEIDGQVLESSLAKPQADQKSSSGSNFHKPALLTSYPPRVGYDLLGGAYGAVGGGYVGAGFVQPMIYGRGPTTPAGMAMMPMLLPDGRIGYVLQQPGAQPHMPPSQQRGGRTGGGRISSRGRHGSENGRGRSRYSYNPY